LSFPLNPFVHQPDRDGALPNTNATRLIDPRAHVMGSEDAGQGDSRTRGFPVLSSGARRADERLGVAAGPDEAVVSERDVGRRAMGVRLAAPAKANMGFGRVV
jgi:hypothetical protein